MTVADKTRIELDRLHCSHESLHLDDEWFGHAGTPQEDLWNYALGFIDCINSDRRRRVMRHRLKALCFAQINIVKVRIPRTSVVKICSGEARLAEVRPE